MINQILNTLKTNYNIHLFPIYQNHQFYFIYILYYYLKNIKYHFIF